MEPLRRKLVDEAGNPVDASGTRSYDDANGQHVAYDASTQSAAIDAEEVTIVASTDCFVKFGANPSATIGAGSMFLTKGLPWTRRITSGWKVAAIKVADAGTLSVMPVA